MHAGCLFEQVYDNGTGDLTYKHYILAGGSRVGVETLEANSGGTVTSDTLSFYVRDEVGSVVATVTENLGGANQSLSLASYGAWGKARTTTGSTAYEKLAPGTFFSPTPAGQEEGFAGHDNLEDTGLVDMEGRVYDPEVGTFLSPDPNVQYPFSSQGYDRYSYVNDNPLSLSDPSGYFSGEQALGLAAAIAMSIYGNEEGWAWYETAFASGAVGGYLGSGGNVQTGVESGLEAVAFSYVGDHVGWGDSPADEFAKSMTEGLIGGVFTEAGGGHFGNGFIGAFVSSELGSAIGEIGGNPNVNPAVYYSAANVSARVVVSAVMGGTVAEMTGGNFSEAAVAAAFQRLYNEEQARKSFLNEFSKSFLTEYQKEYPFEYKLFVKYAGNIDTSLWPNNEEGFRYFELAWQGFTPYVQVNGATLINQEGDAILKAQYGLKATIGKLLPSPVDEILGFPDAISIYNQTMSFEQDLMEWQVLNVEGPQFINARTFQKDFGVPLDSDLPNQP